MSRFLEENGERSILTLGVYAVSCDDEGCSIRTFYYYIKYIYWYQAQLDVLLLIILNKIVG